MEWFERTTREVRGTVTPSLDSLASQLYGAIPKVRQLLQVPFGISYFSTFVNPASDSAYSCPIDGPLSCHNTSVVANTCCFNAPGGQLLQTQFWDTTPPVGPADSWTIHGLWPDHCDGVSFDEYCDRSRSYTNISAILSHGGAQELLDYMTIYWKDYQGNDENLWEHEWGKHGTCISTLETKCYGEYIPQQEVIDYFNTTVALFRTLPTYQTLAAAGVLPSNSRRWMLEEIQNPLTASFGAPVTLRCRNGALQEVWYHFDVQGSVQTGKFVPTSGSGSNCPGTGIEYLPKAAGPTGSPTSTRTVTETKVPAATATTSPFFGRGFLHVLVDGRETGCLISTGVWYTSGACATYRAQTDVSHDKDGEDSEHLFTLTSSKGQCGVVEGRFECAKHLPMQTIFSVKDDRLTYRNETGFYAARVPEKFTKESVYSDVDHGHGLEVEIEWSAAG